MFCLYTLPLARPGQTKIQMLTTSSWIITILLKSLLSSLGLFILLLNLQVIVWKLFLLPKSELIFACLRDQYNAQKKYCGILGQNHFT